MLKLNFPQYQFRLKNSENKTRIFDVVRKKFVVLQPEEWVRQHLVQYLINDKNYPISYINVEKQFTVNNLRKRYDVVVYNKQGEIYILCECKAPGSPISQETFNQAARYNLPLKAKYFIVTNGLAHYTCEVDYEKEKYTFMPEIPDFRT